MADRDVLISGICERLAAEDGPLLLLAPPAVLGALATALRERPWLTLAVSSRPARRLRPLATSGAALLRCAPEHLPVACGCFAAAAAVDTFTVKNGREAIRAMGRALRPSGRLVLADHISRSRTLRALTRKPWAPEDLTRMVLNAGFVDIRQSWTRPHGGAVITSGTLHCLAGL